MAVLWQVSLGLNRLKSLIIQNTYLQIQELEHPQPQPLYFRWNITEIIPNPLPTQIPQIMDSQYLLSGHHVPIVQERLGGGDAFLDHHGIVEVEGELLTSRKVGQITSRLSVFKMTSFRVEINEPLTASLACISRLRLKNKT